MKEFQSINQYDKKFSTVLDEKFKNRNFCGFFSLLTAYQFIQNEGKNNNMNQKIYEECIIKSVINHLNLQVSNSVTFEELIMYTNLLKTDIIATNTELIEQEIIGYNMIFQDIKKPYAIIFLKNAKFFVVLSENNNTFHIRDSHEKIQYDSLTLDEVIYILNEKYQFNKEIDLDGYKVEEYSNIEYLIIQNKFDMLLSFDVVIPNELLSIMEFNNNKVMDPDICKNNNKDTIDNNKINDNKIDDNKINNNEINSDKINGNKDLKTKYLNENKKIRLEDIDKIKYNKVDSKEYNNHEFVNFE